MAVQRRSMDFSGEKQILTNLILSTEYCKRVLPLIKQEYFPSDSTNTILSWVRGYYEAYRSAPGTHIKDIYEERAHALDESSHDQIKAVLQHLSDVADTDIGNVDFLVDSAIELLHIKNLELQVKAATHHLSNNDPVQAQRALEERFNVPDDMIRAINWSDQRYIRDVIRKMVLKDDPSTAFFMYPGRFGEFIGALDRGWFVAFLGPAKRGKTVYLMETIIAGLMRKLNVLFFSFEMPDDQLFMRVLQSVTGAKPGTGDYEVMTPLMDCESNQNGECVLPERTGVGDIKSDEGGLLSYEDLPDWTKCVACRGTSQFLPTSWKEPVAKKGLSEGQYFDRANAFMRIYGKYCRTIFRPSKTCDIDTMENDIDELIARENFVPDVIVIDYADLMKVRRSTGQKRNDLDDLWESLRSLAQTRQILLVTASQTNRGSADAKYIRDVDVAEDWSKIAKLDLGIGLCQTEEMKVRGIMNLNKIAYRHGEFTMSNTCTVLQELGHMQGILDSEFQVA